MNNLQEEQTLSPMFSFEPGNYGDRGAYVPSIACYKQIDSDKWDYHFILVNHDEVFSQEDEASARAEKDLNAGFHQKENYGSDFALAEYLRAQGYVSVEGFKIADDKNGALH